MDEKKFKKVLIYINNAIDELKQINSDKTNPDSERIRAAGLALCLSHLIILLNMSDYQLLRQLSNNLNFIVTEKQKQEEISAVNCIPEVMRQEGGRQIH